MSVESFGTYPPGYLEWHPAHGEIARSDPQTFLLHVQFVRAHGVPQGEFTTFSNACISAAAGRGLESRHGARAR
jgi:hypothetical protein